MLVLTRRPGEEIHVDFMGKRVTFLLSDIKGNQARIAIEAPKEFAITRPDMKMQYARVGR